MTEQTLYMLDTNMVSHFIKGANSNARERLDSVEMGRVCISAITEAELLRGLEKKPEAKKLAFVVKAFLVRVDVLPFDTVAASAYAELRTAGEREGKNLACMDMLIASHALATGCTLVTNDKAFFQFASWLKIEDWTLAS